MVIANLMSFSSNKVDFTLICEFFSGPATVFNTVLLLNDGAWPWDSFTFHHLQLTQMPSLHIIWKPITIFGPKRTTSVPLED